VSLVVVGVHERRVPLDVFERLAIGDSDLPKALERLCDSPHLSEAVVVSTCMRTEVYAVLERFHDGLADILAFFESRLGASPAAASLGEHLLVAYDDAAARHLFEVAAGADSAVLGEGEVLRQVRRAGERALRERAAGPVLAALFRHAVEAGKRVRSETGIARGTTSLAHVAVALARQGLGGSLEGRRALVIGAGEMGQAIAAALAQERPAPAITLANRSTARAAQLAQRLGARHVGLARLRAELADADVVVTATAAGEVLVEEADVAGVLAERAGRPLLVVDAAVPRDVDPAVGSLPGVTLLDLAALTAFADEGRAARRAELASVERVIDEELERYRMSARQRTVAPVVAQLRARAEQVRLAELERLYPLLERLAPEERASVEALSRRIVAKLLHAPTVELKRAAGTPKGQRLAEALRTLFELS